MSSPNLNFTHSKCRLRVVKKVQFGIMSPKDIVSNLLYSLTRKLQRILDRAVSNDVVPIELNCPGLLPFPLILTLTSHIHHLTLPYL
jgi:hypothetical protein